MWVHITVPLLLFEPELADSRETYYHSFLIPQKGIPLPFPMGRIRSIHLFSDLSSLYNRIPSIAVCDLVEVGYLIMCI